VSQRDWRSPPGSRGAIVGRYSLEMSKKWFLSEVFWTLRPAEVSIFLRSPAMGREVYQQKIMQECFGYY
jgi:hypothetical protein